jgi:hypothetical protein
MSKNELLTPSFFEQKKQGNGYTSSSSASPQRNLQVPACHFQKFTKPRKNKEKKEKRRKERKLIPLLQTFLLTGQEPTKYARGERHPQRTRLGTPVRGGDTKKGGRGGKGTWEGSYMDSGNYDDMR